MNRFAIRYVVAATVFAATALISNTQARGDTYKSIMDQSESALVTVKFVAKLQTPQGTRDFDSEFTGLAINDNGLIICSSMQLGTSRNIRSRGGTVTPSDIKILIGDDTIGVDAELVATDSELDLSWLRIKDMSALKSKPGHIDFSKAATPKIGDRILTSQRMHKFYDRAVMISEGRLAGTVKKPRDLLVADSGIDLALGMPVFDENAKVIGIATFQSPDPEDDPEASRTAAKVLILGADKVVKATERALEEAKASEEEEDDSGASEPAKTTEAEE